MKETPAIASQPKEALTLEAEKPSSGTADNTVPTALIAAPITFTPVKNGFTENGGETANIVEAQ